MPSGKTLESLFPAHPLHSRKHPIMDELEQLRADVLARKHAQNARRLKAGKPLMWPSLAPLPVKPKKPKRSSSPPPPESGDEDDTQLSFDEWKEAGWAVKKGMKCSGFDILGIPQFTRLQVQRINAAWAKFRQRNKS